MKGPLGVMVVALACGCGRTERDPEGPLAPTAEAGAPSTAVVGVGPFDTTDLPAQAPLMCPDRADVPALQLPCLIGGNLAGDPEKPGYHGVECKLVGKPDSVAISFMLPLASVPGWLNKPEQLPFKDTPPAPPGQGVSLGGEPFAGSLTGVITFTQVDLDARAVAGTLSDGHIIWTSATAGDDAGFACDVLSGPFWAVRGSFI